MGCFEVSGGVAGTMCDLPVSPSVGWYRGFSLQNKQRKVRVRVLVCFNPILWCMMGLCKISISRCQYVLCRHTNVLYMSV